MIDEKTFKKLVAELSKPHFLHCENCDLFTKVLVKVEGKSEHLICSKCGKAYRMYSKP